jgi:high affinity Mn2+ porin
VLNRIRIRLRIGRKQWKRIGLLVLFISLVCNTSKADEIEDLKKRAEDLPIFKAFGIKISGGLTGIFQGSLNNPKEFGGNGAAGEFSADLSLDGSIGDKRSFRLRFDFEHGAGLTDFPPVFTNPDGNTTGPNNDVETFIPRDVVNEAWYTHRLFGDFLEITLGKIDLTGYFDQNKYANKETFQYIAQTFNNNNAIDWGGSVNFFGLGIVLVAYPTKTSAISLGWFQGDGNYKSLFDHPFLMAQLSFTTHWAGREGNYRFYGWGRLTPHCMSKSDPTVFLDCSLVDSADQIRIEGRNVGVGASLDQQLSDSVGFWARMGFQDPHVSQFNSAFSVGVTTSGSPIGRPNDAIGIAYGIAIPSGDYKEATGFSEIEHYIEIYYKFVVTGDGSTTGFHLTPDFQLVANPGGDGSVHPVIVPGLRAQFHF